VEDVREGNRQLIERFDGSFGQWPAAPLTWTWPLLPSSSRLRTYLARRSHPWLRPSTGADSAPSRIPHCAAMRNPRRDRPAWSWTVPGARPL